MTSGINTREMILEILLQINEEGEHSHIAIRNALSNIADYFPSNDGGYLVRCQVREHNSTLIDLTLSVPSKEEADSICHNWQKKSQTLYAYVMKELL